MRRMRSGCCARAASGRAAAAPPRSVMNCRLCMCPLRTRREQGLKPSTLRSGGEWQSGPMSALGQKRTSAPQQVMSALPSKADMCGATRDVRFGPIADISTLFDHLVGARLHCRRHVGAVRASVSEGRRSCSCRALAVRLLGLTAAVQPENFSCRWATLWRCQSSVQRSDYS
jgi:hypothetical protein